MSAYCYTSLREGYIRLLRLMPHRDEHAPIQAQLFDYPLQDSGRGTHLYEALSYVWGSNERARSVSTDKGCIPVTMNLLMALKRLRDHSLDRIIWVDAICINQDDTYERSNQVQSMAKIYAKASRVVIWLEEPIATDGRGLGEATTDGGRALKILCGAVNGKPTESSGSETDRQTVLTLLQRSWFQRIWVLQEVAAARHVLIVCRSAEIDGYAFCAGLNTLKLNSQDSYTQIRVRSVAYLIKGAILRPKYATSHRGIFSLGIHSLNELLDMFHDRKATDRRDKVYALLGMSSNDYIPAGLLPNYNISWKDLFYRVVKSIVGEQAFVETWEEKETAAIKSKGCVLGWVSKVERDREWDDKQNLDITLKKPFWRLGESVIRWTLHTSAKPIQDGDIVCLLQGPLKKPTIVRLCQDYCAVIAIAVTTTDGKSTEDSLQSVTTFNREFLLVWDWKESWTELRDGEDYECFMNRRELNNKQTNLEHYLDNATRLRNVALILGDSENYDKAYMRLQKAIDFHKRAFGKDISHILAAMDSLTFMFRDRGDRVYLGQADYEKADKLGVMTDILGRRGGYAQITSEVIVRIAGSLDQDVMTLLLDWRKDEAQITEEVVKAAAGNEGSGRLVMLLLLDNCGADVKITEEVVKAAAKNERSGGDIMGLLLKKRGADFKITEEVVKAAAKNERSGRDIMGLLLDNYGADFKITEEVVKAAARHEESGRDIMRLLLKKRGADFKITEEVVKAAAGNMRSGINIMTLLLNKRGTEVKITEEVAKVAAGNMGEWEDWKNPGGVMKLLLDQRGADVKITEEVVKAAAGNEGIGVEIMTELLDRRGAEIIITEEVIKTAVARNDRSGWYMMELLLDWSGADVKITEEVVKIAAKNEKNGWYIMELLLDRRGTDFKITEDVIKVAAGNRGSGDPEDKGVMALLLNRRDAEVKINEEVVKAVAGNTRLGKDLMVLLLNRRGADFKINEEVVKAVAGNEEKGWDIMKLLLDRRGANIKVTEEVVKAAAKNKRSGRDIMELLLDNCDTDFKITEEVVKAVAGNEWKGWDIMKLLLDRRGADIKVTEEVVKAAAGNKWSGERIIELLLGESGANIKITDEVVKAAARNEKSGRKVMALLLERCGAEDN